MNKFFKIGDKVIYKNREIGIVKSISNKFIFVVYNYDEDYGHYENYTAAATLRKDLELANKRIEENS